MRDRMQVARTLARTLAWLGAIAIVFHSLYALERDRRSLRTMGTLVATLSRNLHWLEQLETPRAGEREVLPRSVLAMLYVLEKNGVNTYRYSDAIGKPGGGVRQRLIEGAWPRRPDPDSPFVLSFASEQLAPHADAAGECEEIDSIFVPDSTLGVSLARCR